MADGTITFKPLLCPICEQQDFEAVGSRDRYGIPVQTVVCRCCGMLQTNPYPDDRSLGWFYGNIFGPLHRGTSSPSQRKFEDRRRYAREILDWLHEHGVSVSGTVVDVGCGSGGVLRGLADAGLHGIGVEIDLDYAADGRSRGLDIRLGNIDAVNLPEGVALVTYVQVLEHIVDVNSEVERLAHSISRDSVVFIEVPGLSSVPEKYHYDVLRMFQLAHIWHFEPATLKALFAKHGFVCMAIDDTVRALFRYDPEAAKDQALQTPHASDVVKRIEALERRRLVYWRTWAMSAKALLRRVSQA